MPLEASGVSYSPSLHLPEGETNEDFFVVRFTGEVFQNYGCGSPAFVQAILLKFAWQCTATQAAMICLVSQQSDCGAHDKLFIDILGPRAQRVGGHWRRGPRSV